MIQKPSVTASSTASAMRHQPIILLLLAAGSSFFADAVTTPPLSRFFAFASLVSARTKECACG